jgi:hypothetical protein
VSKMGWDMHKPGRKNGVPVGVAYMKAMHDIL